MAISHRRGRRFPPDVLARADELIRRRLPAREVYEKLVAEFGPGDAPSQRAIQNWVRNFRHPDESEMWSLSDGAAGVDAALVLEVLRALLRLSNYRAVGITVEEARFLTAIRVAVPEIHPLLAYNLAVLYAGRRASEHGTADIEALLALRPWTDAAYAHYEDMYRKRVEAGGSVEPRNLRSPSDTRMPITTETIGALEVWFHNAQEWDDALREIGEADEPGD